jgi:hypothetical protein
LIFLIHPAFTGAGAITPLATFSRAPVQDRYPARSLNAAKLRRSGGMEHLRADDRDVDKFVGRKIKITAATRNSSAR